MRLRDLETVKKLKNNRPQVYAVFISEISSESKALTSPRLIPIKDGMKSALAVNKVADVTIMTEKNSQPYSSKGLTHPTLNLLQSLFHEHSHKYILTARLNNQKMMGKVSAEWWCVIDSILMSVQKMIKIRKNVEEGKQ